MEDLAKSRPELFDRSAEHRPCGLLDRYSAYAMLICDVHWLPLLPWVLAEPIGKSMVKKDQGLSAEKSKAKKATMRKGVDVKKAVADVLCRAVRLPIPSAA